LREAAKKFKGSLAVGVDANDGKIAINGWKTVTDIDAASFCEGLVGMGVDTVIYTDISRDGTLAGTNIGAYRRLVSIKGLKVIASGGITFLDEIVKLRDMGVYGAILGKALYEGKLDLSKALAAAKGAKC